MYRCFWSVWDNEDHPGMTWSLSFEPLLSWTTLGLLAIPMALLAVLALWRRQRGALFRLVALAALALALLNPVLLDELRQPLKSVVALVVDRSQSQDIRDRSAQTDAALAELKTRLARFNQFEVREIEAGQAASACSCPIRAGSGRAAMKAADRMSRCTVASRIG